MRLAARLLFRKGKRVLLSDLEWPAYKAILENEGRRTGGEVKEVPLREFILNDRASPEEVASLLTACCSRHGCDGLFLSSVTYEGIRLPVRQVARSLVCAPRAPFVVVDGAQGFCHAPAELEHGYCDFFLAGCHKWLRAYQPMGLGFCGRESAQDFIQSVCNEMMAAGELDDPLLHFTSWMNEGTRKHFTETVSLGPLFSCAAAVEEALDRTINGRNPFSDLVRTARKLEHVSLGTGWVPLVSHDQLRSGILLLHSQARRLNTARPDEVRERFQKCGVALTAYEHGVVRLSAPQERWQEEDSALLRVALEKTASCDKSSQTLAHVC
jgi:selenocysteine lyase/cysteine desulfurase